MNNEDILSRVKEKANKWLESPIDEASKESIRNMMTENEPELIECFYKDL